MGQDVALYRFASLADYERANAALAEDASLARSIGKMLEEVEMAETTKIGSPLGEAAERGLERALADRPAVPGAGGGVLLSLSRVLRRGPSPAPRLSRLGPKFSSPGSKESP